MQVARSDPPGRQRGGVMVWLWSALVACLLLFDLSATSAPAGAWAWLLAAGWVIGLWWLTRVRDRGCPESAPGQADSAYWRRLLDRTADWESWQSLDGRLLYVSPACERITGYPPAAFLADPDLLQRMVHPEDSAAFVAHLAECHLAPFAASGRKNDQLDFRIRTASGEVRWIGHQCALYAQPDDPYPGVRSSNRDISPRKQARMELARTTALLEAVNLAQSLYLGERAASEVFSGLLQTLVTMTSSEYGFLDEVLYDARGPYKLSLALSDLSWDAASRALYQGLVARRLEFRDLNNLAGEPVLTGKLVIANDAPHHAHAKGTPPGHPRVRCFMGIPVYYGADLVGVAGVANRAGGYDPALAEWLAPFLGACAAIIHAMRIERERSEALAALELANQHNRALLEASLDPLVVIDADGRISDVNLATERATGQPRERLLGSDFSAYFSDPEKAREGYRTAFDHGQVRDYALNLMHGDGRSMPVLYNATAYRDQDGKVERVFAAARDVTEIKRLSDMLEARLRLLDRADESTLEEILRASVDEAVTLTESLIGFLHFLEADGETLKLQTWSTRTLEEFCHAEGSGQHYPVSQAGVWCDCVRQGRAIIHNDMASLAGRRGMPSGHAEVIRELVVPVFRGGRIVAILGVGNKPRFYNQADLHTVATFADLAWDIAERKRDAEALAHMARFDALTGLPNRVLLADRMRIAMAESQRDNKPLAVCYLDLDGFKPINDSLGHAAGDRLLRVVAARMKAAVRAGDTVARIGGDEFVLLLGHLRDDADALATLERLREALEAPIELGGGRSGEVSASIGLVFYRQDATDADTLLRQADSAMYAAKNAGRRRVHQFVNL